MNLFTLISKSNTLSNTSALFGRIGLSAIFILSGLSKLQYSDATAQYMASAGVPGELLPLVILIELVGGVFIAAGFLTQLVALTLAGFSAVSALLFHNNLADQMEFIMFFKNIAMSGGFLMLAAMGAGAFSIDARLLATQA